MRADPVTLASHKKAMRAKAAQLAQAREREAAALAEFHQSIRDAFAAGVTLSHIQEATGLKSRNHIYDIGSST